MKNLILAALVSILASPSFATMSEMTVDCVNGQTLKIKDGFATSPSGKTFICFVEPTANANEFLVALYTTTRPHRAVFRPGSPYVRCSLSK